MIDYIKNGVTTGGEGSVINQLPDTANMYLQYLSQVRQERNNALNKNYDMVRNMDLSKVDPRDREAVQKDYEQWRTLALSPPQSNKRGEYNNWRAQVLQGESDLKNRIGDIIGTRKSIADYIGNNKDRLDYDGINQGNKWLNSSVVDANGTIIKPDFESLKLKPEHVYDTDKDIEEFKKINLIKGQQLKNWHRDKDGKQVQVFADVLNTNGVASNVMDAYNNKPEFRDAIDKQFRQYQALNPGTTATVEDFIDHKVRSSYAGMNDRDKQYNDQVNPGNGFIGYNYVLKDPNEHRQYVNINAQASAADKLAARQREYQNTLGSVARAFHSYDPNDLVSGSELLSQSLRGLKYGDMGTISGVHLEKGADGKGYVNFITKNDEYSIPKQKILSADDPNLYRVLHNTYNQQYHKQPQNMLGEDDYNKFQALKKGIDGMTSNFPQAQPQPQVQVQAKPGLWQGIKDLLKSKNKQANNLDALTD